jgi:cystathionine gamma-synthase
MDDSNFEAMAKEVEGLLGIDPASVSMRKDSLLVHGLGNRGDASGAVSTPIYQSATYAHPAYGESTGYCYDRCGNPTRLVLEETIAALEGGRKAFAVTSGMTAISAVVKLFGSGDHLLVCSDLYGGTYRLFHTVYERYGLEFTYVDPTDMDAVREAWRPNTKALFIETPSNPMMKVADIQALADYAHERGALLVADNTFLTAYYQRPFDFGADVVVYSGTKYLCGHNDVLSGFVVVKDQALIEPIYNAILTEGGVLPPFDSWLMIRSLKTLGMRMRVQSANAAEVARFLKSHPAVTAVHYVGDPDHPQYALSCAQTSGFGAMISFSVADKDAVPRILESVKLVRYAESLGGVESLITFPLVQTHGAMPTEMREELGIDEHLLRLSVGAEDVQDIIADLDQALS